MSQRRFRGGQGPPIISNHHFLVAPLPPRSQPSAQEKRLVDGFDSLTEITGSEKKLDPVTHKEVKEDNASEDGGDGGEKKDNMWKDVPHIEGPAGFSTGHSVYNTQGKRDIESYPSDIKSANDKFNANFKDHKVGATLDYTTESLQNTESYVGDVQKQTGVTFGKQQRRATTDYAEKAKAYKDSISVATDKYIDAVGKKPVSAAAAYAEEITKATSDYTSGLAGLRRVVRRSEA